VVEDNEGDILLTKEALKDGIDIEKKISVTRDGEEAILFLNKVGKYAGEDSPDIIFLDINLPKKNGIEVLQYIKSSLRLRHIPVIILTTSSSELDVISAYNNLANCFITKPMILEDFLALMTDLERFWFSVARLPAKNDHS
jgi:CheY-like chemotaxis protein